MAGFIDVAGDRLRAFVKDAESGVTALKGFASALHTVFDIQEMINAGYKTGTQAGGGTREATTSEHDEDIARRIENFENELKGAFGKDNFAAASMDNVVKGLRAGVLTPNQAMEVIRGTLGAYFTGGQLFAELASPDAAIRKLAEEMERLLAGGTLNP